MQALLTLVTTSVMILNVCLYLLREMSVNPVRVQIEQGQ